MGNIFVISDTHFSHSNILKFTDKVGKPIRPFQSVQEMDQTMVDNWNATIKPGDKVYHLGDVFFGSPVHFKALWPRLNGRKRLIVGNHCDVRFLSSGGFFDKVMLWRKFDEFLFTHVPVHPSTLTEHRFTGQQIINVHGHTHQNGPPKGSYVSACVELTTYKPVPLEDLKQLHKDQQRLFHGLSV
jgi:calcineurin-like phosphoesterase family protein